MTEEANASLIDLTSKIVSSYVSANRVEAAQLPGLIKTVHDSLASAGAEPKIPEPELIPAVAIKKSVFPDHIVCLEDGKKLKMLKRHLKTSYDLTPDAYRTKWGLPRDYPMVAPNYALIRSGLAKKIGLGRKAETAPAEPTPPTPPKKGRASKAA